jgi:hypothetical protein
MPNQHTGSRFLPEQILEALTISLGSRLAAAELLGTSLRTIERGIAQLRTRGIEIPRNSRTTLYSAQDLNAAHEAAPDGHMVKGVSTLYDEEGNVKQRWIKTDTDKEQQLDILKGIVEGLFERVPYVPTIDPPLLHGNDNLLNLYTITDFHMGMLAWRRETGDDWDLNIAKRVLLACMEDMIKRSPMASIAVFNQLGDFVHFDGLEAVTPTSRHILDADSRFEKVVDVVVDVLITVVEMLLYKYPQVHVKMAEGNHDIASSVWLRKLFARLFKDNPRVTVDQSPSPYYVYQHGKTMLAFHHGHLAKKDNAGAKVPALFPKIWGDTEHRYLHMGHLHSEFVKEENGIKTQQHPTLSGRDAYAARGAWFSDRGAKCITYHREHGELGHVQTSPEMLSL